MFLIFPPFHHYFSVVISCRYNLVFVHVISPSYTYPPSSPPTQFGDAVYSSIPFALNEEFSPVLRRQLDYYNHDPSSDRISAVKSELNDVKGTMVHNIEKVGSH